MFRRGFTLLEMLVASMVFIVGFVSVFSLFLAGMKFRQQGDLDTRAAIAVRNLVEEIQIDAGCEASGPFAVDAYKGSGFAEPVKGTPAPSDDEFFPCPGMTGLFYRVLESKDCSGNAPGASTDTSLATVLHLRILIVAFATNPPLKVSDLLRRLKVQSATMDTPTIQELVRRGIATDNHVAIVRQPSWMKNLTTP